MSSVIFTLRSKWMVSFHVVLRPITVSDMIFIQTSTIFRKNILVSPLRMRWVEDCSRTKLWCSMGKQQLCVQIYCLIQGRISSSIGLWNNDSWSNLMFWWWPGCCNANVHSFRRSWHNVYWINGSSVCRIYLTVRYETKLVFVSNKATPYKIHCTHHIPLIHIQIIIPSKEWSLSHNNTHYYTLFHNNSHWSLKIIWGS
jgi:hypothetical protein